MLTLAKLYWNTDPDRIGKNQLISRTFGKIALVDSSWECELAECPQDGQFWLVDVIKETAPGKMRGAFIVRPVRRVDERRIKHLVPGAGMYDEEVVSGVLVITPKKLDCEWILGMDARKFLARAKGCYAVVVNLGGDPWPTARLPDGVSFQVAGG